MTKKLYWLTDSKFFSYSLSLIVGLGPLSSGFSLKQIHRVVFVGFTEISFLAQPYQMVLCRLIHYNIIKAYDLSFNPFATSIILFTEAYALTKDEQHIMLLHRIFFAYCS